MLNLLAMRFFGVHVAEGVAKIILLFYVVEQVLNNIGSRWKVALYAMFATLGILGLRGIW